MKTSSVYEVVDVQTGEVVYVGKADDPVARWAVHVSQATSPLIQAMVANGTDRYEMRVVAEFPTPNDALNHERTLVNTTKPPFNRHTYSAMPLPSTKRVKKVWNGRLSRCKTYNVWFGKWRESVGIWRLKRLPSSVQDHNEGLAWFENWLREQGLL